MASTVLAATPVASSEQTPPPISRAAVWHRSAPKAVRAAYLRGDEVAGWAAWQEHLAGRKAPAGLDDLLLGDLGSTDVSLSAMGVSPVLVPLHGQDARGTRDCDLAEASEALACCRALLRLAATLPADRWWSLLERLIGLADDAQAIVLDDQPLMHQLLAGELPLTLAYLLPEIAGCRQRTALGRRALSAGLIDLLDGKGLPHARYLESLQPLLACWTRCRALRGGLTGGCWMASAERQYRGLVRSALRLTRPDGSNAFGDGRASAGWRELLDTALKLTGDPVDRRIATLALPRPKRAVASRRDPPDLPRATLHSPWAAIAVLRPSWAACGERLTVVYAGQAVRLELCCGEEVVASGVWELEVRRDGTPLAATSQWEDVCWFTDKDVDYLELEIDLVGGVRVQRHILLARKDHFALLADAVLGEEPGRLEYRGTVPLCQDVAFRAASESREGILHGRKRRTLVMPLALPEWRADAGAGELSQSGGGLELVQTAVRRRLFAPLLLDLDPRRMARRRTWRQLTIAESGVIQAPEAAVGYRVAIGREQWLIYRSLGPAGNRTLLGHNLISEMLVARFDQSGEVESLVEVE